MEKNSVDVAAEWLSVGPDLHERLIQLLLTTCTTHLLPATLL